MLAGLVTKSNMRKSTQEIQYFNAPYVKKKFSWSGQLKTHNRTHTAEKNFDWLKCGQYFSWFDCLKIHYRIHTGENLFVCSQCDKCVTPSRDLKAGKAFHLHPVWQWLQNIRWPKQTHEDQYRGKTAWLLQMWHDIFIFSPTEATQE